MRVPLARLAAIYGIVRANVQQDDLPGGEAQNQDDAVGAAMSGTFPQFRHQRRGRPPADAAGVQVGLG